MLFYWLRQKLTKIHSQWIADKENEKKIQQVEQGVYRDAKTFLNSKFSDDFAISSNLIRVKMNERFPDNYHARLLPGYNPKHDYSTARSEAIDTSSAAIATSLRNGSGVEDAVISGSKSIGL